MDAEQGAVELSGTERAVLGRVSVDQVRTRFSAYTADRLGSPVAGVLFRAGRIDVVWGVVLADGREVVVKVHRPPTDRAALTGAVDAQRLLAAEGFPCPEPLSGPDEVDGLTFTAERLLGGPTPDGHDPANRRLLAAGLAEHIARLRARPDLVARAGAGPSWCRYVDGPWPLPHDPIVDFRTTPEGFGWLDDLARRAADQILRSRAAAEVVVGHADWYAGNTAIADGALVATFDWELVADTEAVIAGFAAAFGASSTSGAGLSDPEQTAAFLGDYESVRSRPLTADERRAAAAAAGWILAFNARWQVGLGDREPAEGTALALVAARAADYLALDW